MYVIRRHLGYSTLKMYNAATFINGSDFKLMNILLNGEPHTIEDNAYISTLIGQLNLVDKRLAVEVNREIIPKSKHDQHIIHEGDTIEIVYAIGGG